MSNKKKKKSQASEETVGQQVISYGMNMLMSIYVFVILVIYPLYYRNKYFDMGEAKYAFFRSSSIIFLIFFLVFLALWMIIYRNKYDLESSIRRLSVTDLFVIAFCVLSYISYLLSEFRTPMEEGGSSALTGYTGWYMGLTSQVMFVLIYFAVSRFWSWSSFTIFSAIAASGVIYQLAVWQRFSIDPLGMYINLAPEYIEKFVSTLGQTTWFSSYAVLAFPLSVFYYWHTKKNWVRIFSGVVVSLGFASLCTANSDSGYVAYVLILMVFFWFSLESNQRFCRFLEILLIALGSFRVIGIMQICFPERLPQLVSEDQKISFFITQSRFMLIVLLVVAAVYGVFYFSCRDSWREGGRKGNNETDFDISRFLWLRWVMLTGAAVVLLSVAALIVMTTRKILPQSLAGLYDVGFFTFDEAWGNFRGFNWRMAFKAMSKESVREFLVGIGPDCFAMSMDKYFAKEIEIFWHGQQLACAHNEFLNMMVTQGVLGLTAYLGIFISFIVRATKMGKDKAVLAPFIAAVCAYIGHNFFCYQQCICTPTVFMLMGIGELLMRERENQKE